MNRALRFNGSVKSAISAALHDLAGKRLGVPLYKLWGLDPAKAPLSSFTIAIAANDAELRERVAQARAVSGAQDQARHRSRRADHSHGARRGADKILRVDANAAWTAKQALRMIDVLVECGVEYVEQPLPAHDLDGLRFVRERSVAAGHLPTNRASSRPTFRSSSASWTASTSSCRSAAACAKR